MNCSTDESSCTVRCVKIALLAIAGIAALGGVVMALWNWLMPALFVGALPVSYGQALGLLLLSKILFGSFRGACHGGWRGRPPRFENITPEERVQLKSRWGHWCRSGQRDDGGAARSE